MPSADLHRRTVLEGAAALGAAALAGRPVDAQTDGPGTADGLMVAHLPVPDALSGDPSKGYRYQDGVSRGEFEYMGIPPAGSMIASATDMARFMLTVVLAWRDGY